MNLINSLKLYKLSLILPHRIYLVWHLVKREFILQYKRSFLGVLWSLLLPIAQLLVLIFIFQKVIPLHIKAYPLFLFSALLPWNWFNNCLTSAGNIFINNRDLIRKPNFEPSILVIVNTLSNLLLFIIALPLLFVLMILFDTPFSIALIFLPLLIVIQGLLIIGLSMMIATFNSFYTDIQQIVGVVVMMLFFLTPIFYNYESISESFRLLYFLNPMATLIQNYRLILFYGIIPSIASMVVTLASSIIAMSIGYVVYKRHIHKVVDLI